MNADSLQLSWLDVFTDSPLSGNQLAVVHDADILDTARMQAIAAELRLSETVFVLEDANRLRIFSPRMELPLAGHPVVGAALELASLGRIPSDGSHVFLTGVGETPVTISDGVATMTQAEFELGPEFEPAEIAPLLGLATDDVFGAPVVCSTTRFPKAFAEVSDHDTLRSVEPDLTGIARLTDVLGLVAWCEAGEGELAQRFFAPRMGVAEDPATGAAAGALAALRVYAGAAPGDVIVRQGEEIGRPSVIQASVGGSEGAPADIRVGGRAVRVMQGELRL